MRSHPVDRFFQLNVESVRAVFSRDRICFLILLVITLGMYFALPRRGDIDWPDASRHALNGAFVLDFLSEFPWRHPVDFAYDYYRQWPALTILFYPPLFDAALAAAYAGFGVSEATALLVELAFLLLLAWGAFRLSRHWLDPPSALATALLVVGAPELAFWGRQIMLDVPAYAFLIWAGEFLIRYLSGHRKRTLFAAVVCTAAAVYTKYNAVFFVAPIAISLAYVHGRRVLHDYTVLQAVSLGSVLMLPIVVIFFAFGRYNLAQAAAVPDADATRWSIAALTYYARVIPYVISWPTLVLGCVYLLAVPFVAWLRLPVRDAVFLGSWVLIGYAFYSMIAVKEPRHILFVTYPIALAAMLTLDRAFVGFRIGFVIPLLFGGGVLTATLAATTVPAVAGVRQSAEAVARLAPPETNIAFWGSRDGTFIYGMRAYSGRRDVGVVRLDKLLFSDLTVYFEHGFKENVMKPDRIADILRDLHVQYVVFQTRYHDDLTSVKALEEALTSDKFDEVERIPMSANYGRHYMADLVIYRLKADVPRGRVAPQMQIRLLGQSL